MAHAPDSSASTSAVPSDDIMIQAGFDEKEQAQYCDRPSPLLSFLVERGEDNVEGPQSRGLALLLGRSVPGITGRFSAP